MSAEALTREPGHAYLLDIIRDARHRSAAAAPQVASWLHWLQAVKQLAPASLYAYEKRVTPLLRMFPDVPLEDFTEDHLIALLSRTKDGSKHPVTTAFVSLFRTWAYNRDLIPKDPTRLLNERRGGKRQTYKETFTDPEVDSLVRLPGEHGFRMMLMLYTGLRISELCNLQVKDVHIDTGPDGPVGQVVVLKGKGNKDREVPMPQKLVYMSPFVNDPDFVLHVGDALEVLGTLPDESVHCVVTSPPYWGLRDYGTGSWEGGDDGCDHQPPKQPERKFTNGRGEGAGRHAGSNGQVVDRGDGSYVISAASAVPAG
jgi:hypothetical protein